MVLLTIGLICVIFIGAMLGAFMALAKHPPVVNIEVPPITVVLDLSTLIPTPLVIQAQIVPPDRVPTGIQEEPMPLEIYMYCAQESEEHAVVGRQRHARALRNELGSWEAALTRLKQEDGIA